MAAKLRIKLNHAGIRELLLSAPVGAEVKNAAERVANAAGDGFEVTEAQQRGGNKNATFKGRVGYGVVAATYEAKLAEAEHKTLSKAVQSCR